MKSRKLSKRCSIVNCPVTVKIGAGEVFIRFHIELDRKIGVFLGCECVHCLLKEGCLSCLSGCEDNDVFSVFDPLYKISSFLSTCDDVVIFRIDGSVCAEGSHGIYLVVSVFICL